MSNETESKQTFGFTLTGDDQGAQMLRLILATTLETKAKLDALILHVNCELAYYLHPASEAEGEREARRLAELFAQRVADTTERVMGEIAARRE